MDNYGTYAASRHTYATVLYDTGGTAAQSNRLGERSDPYATVIINTAGRALGAQQQTDVYAAACRLDSLKKICYNIKKRLF